jgi:uncharacterized protein YndB with AHSA1/START domain
MRAPSSQDSRHLLYWRHRAPERASLTRRAAIVPHHHAREVPQMQVDFQHINMSVKLATSRDRVWQALTTPSGITSWWSERAEIEPSDGGLLRLLFPNRRMLDSKVIMCRPPHFLSFVYFGGTRASFEVTSHPAGGSVVTVSDSGFSSQEDYAETLAHWASVLLALKAFLDFGVDLRNHTSAFNWEKGYVDN